MDLKRIYQKYKPLLQPVLYARNRVLGLKISGGRGNTVTGLQQCRMKACRFSFSGTGNTVQIGDMSTMYGVNIQIVGSGNRILIGSRAYLDGCTFTMEDDGGEITLGSHTYIYNGTELAVLEGTKITMGEDCLISSDVKVRTGDSHSILEVGGGRINPSQDISLGNHVWVGTDCKILKNAHIAHDCIIGTGAIVTGGTTEPNTVYAGNPARPLRSNVTWDHDRV